MVDKRKQYSELAMVAESDQAPPQPFKHIKSYSKAILKP